ncbi:SusC/RagA family TonB-linked outer membrane protein [Siphonobacter curvatus]|nr:TonB-dependent receptor [Siphonobacter curvatus]
MRKSKRIKLMRVGLIACGIMLTAAGSLLAEKSYSQHLISKKVTLELRETSLEKAIETLRKTSHIDFTYNNNELRKIKIPAGTFTNDNVGHVLTALLDHTAYAYRETDHSIVIFKRREALPVSPTPVHQPLVAATVKEMAVRVKGKVIDSKGVTLPGVSVVIKDTQRGTLTDQKGEFTLDNVKETDVLIFTFVGFKTQEVVLGNRVELEVVLDESIKGLDEVVVVGYGTQKKGNLTGAVSTVETDKFLKSRPVTDVARGLQGAVPGLTISTTSGDLGTNPQIRLRGLTGSLNAGNGAQPLILVDNVEIQSLQMVNPDDIESISVLKDAASTSIYGSRAAWGVVLITTKSGKKNTRSQVTYSTNFSYSTPTTTPKIAGAAEGPEYALAAARRSNPAATTFGTVGMYFTDESIQKIRDWEAQYGGQNLGNDMVLGRDFEIKDGRLYFYRPWDAEAMFMRKWAPQQTHNLGITGGSDKTSYNLSLGYLDQQGVLKDKTDRFDRYNGTFSINSSINKWLDINGKILFSKSVFETPFSFTGTAFDPLYYLYRWQRVYPYGTYEGKPFRSAVSEVQQAQMINTTENFLRATIGGRLKLMEGLTIDANYTYSNTNRHIRDVGGKVMAWNQWNGVPLKYESYASASYDRVVYRSLWDEMHTVKAFGTYQKELTNHSIKVIAGMDMDIKQNWDQRSERRNLLDMNLGELPLATGDQYVDGGRGHWATQGFFGRLNYSYKDKFLVELNGRYDGSSFFPTRTQWAFFPSVSAGYVISEEPFMKPIEPIVSSLKIRGSYGSLGNTDVGSTTFRPTMATSNSNWWIGSTNMLTVNTPALVPASLTWETISTLDFGADAKLLKNKVGVTFDWYRRTTSDMITTGIQLPSSFGAAAPRRNYGEMQTTGWELAVDFNHGFSNGLNINLGVNLSDFTEKITRFDGTLVNGNYAGKKLGEIWGYETDRFFTKDDFLQDANGNLTRDAAGKYILKDGIPTQTRHESGWFFYGPGDVKYKDLNGDGTIFTGSSSLEDHGDLKVIGNSTPRYQYGVRLGADWKGFDFNMFWQGVGKRELWPSGGIFIPGFNPNDAMYAHQMDYWTEENPNAFYPRPTNTGQSNNTQNFLIQSKYLLNMAYLRLKNMTLGYTLPKTLTERIRIERCRVYVNGENLLTFDNLSIPIDPEVAYLNASSQPATFGRVYPYRRTFSFGLQLTF